MSTVRSFARLESVDPGFRPFDVVSVQLSLPAARYNSPRALQTFADRLVPRLEMIAGVTDTAAISLLPLSGLLSTVDFRVVGRAEPAPDAVPQGHFRVVTPAYFKTMGIPVREGREFDEADRDGGQPVALVSHTFASRSWPNGGAIGAQIVTGIESTPRVVVGVVADVKQFSLDVPATADLYIPLGQMPANQAPFMASRMYWVVGARAGVQPDQLASAVRAELRRLDPEVATSTMRRLETVVADSLEARRFNVQLVSAFGQVGLVLVAIGVYGVTAFAVGGRRREIGIRVAFGATPGHVLRLVMGSELKAVVVGLVIGAAAVAAASTLLSRWLFQAAAVDVWSVVVAAATLMAVATLACYLPARDSGVRDPSNMLRS
jgi:predicted permease